MAIVTRVTTAEEDAAITAAAGGDALESFVLRHLDHLITHWVAVYRAGERAKVGSLYEQASPEDKAIVDTTLAKYAVVEGVKTTP